MSDKRTINALDVFRFESSDDNDLVSKITSVDGTGIPFKEDNTDEEEVEETDEESENLEESEEDINTEENSIEETDEDLEESGSEEESEEELGPYSTMANLLIEEGILVQKEDKEYTESDEGIAELFADSLDIKNQEYIDSLESRVLRQGVTLKDLITFLDEGGDPNEFLEKTIGQVDYTNVNVITDEEDEEGSINTQKLVIKDKLLLDDVSEEDIEEMLEHYENSGILEKQAKIALKTLVKKQEEEYSQMLENQKQTKLARTEYLKTQDAELKKTVLGLTKIANFDTTEKEREDFLKFLTIPVKKDNNGNLLTQYQIDSVDRNKVLELAFLQFKGGIGSIEAKVEKKKNLKLQEKLSRFAEENKNNNRSTESFDSDVRTNTKSNSNTKKASFKLPYDWML